MEDTILLDYTGKSLSIGDRVIFGMEKDVCFGTIISIKTPYITDTWTWIDIKMNRLMLKYQDVLIK